jgi:hypothetical protein
MVEAYKRNTKSITIKGATDKTKALMIYHVD